jgi:hypothetical protein
MCLSCSWLQNTVCILPTNIINVSNFGEDSDFFVLLISLITKLVRLLGLARIRSRKIHID